MKKKSDTLSAFLLFKKQVELQLGCKINQLQTDGGGEFCSAAFAAQLHNFKIQHRVSCPYTSKQNGLIERRHQRIVEIDLVLLA